MYQHHHSATSLPDCSHTAATTSSHSTSSTLPARSSLPETTDLLSTRSLHMHHSDLPSCPSLSAALSVPAAVLLCVCHPGRSVPAPADSCGGGDHPSGSALPPWGVCDPHWCDSPGCGDPGYDACSPCGGPCRCTSSSGGASPSPSSSTNHWFLAYAAPTPTPTVPASPAGMHPFTPMHPTTSSPFPFPDLHAAATTSFIL